MCSSDLSALVCHQSSGEWDALDPNMALYRFHVQKISGFFDGCEFFHIARADNEAADELSKIGSARLLVPPGVALEHLRKPSITPAPGSESINLRTELNWGAEPKEVGVASTSVDPGTDRKSTRLNSSHITRSRMPSSA